MKSLQLREAKATLSAVIEAAENGHPTTITKHGRPAAVVVPVADARRIYPDDRPSLAEFLLGMPEAIDTERDPSPMRDVDL